MMMRASMSQLDTHPTPPPPGRIQKSKYMDYWKNPEDSKEDGDVGDHIRNLKQKRVFGTQRNTNVMVKAKIEKKSTPKLRVETTQEKLKSNEKTHKSVESPQNDEASRDKDVNENADGEVEPEGIEKAEGSEETKINRTEEEKPAEESEVKPKKKKSVGFQEKVDEEGAISASAPRTPVQLSSSLCKPRRSGTPYHTAQNCRRCKIDKMESFSYWIEQIKLAESIGKHFVSAAFFRLAHDCNAEPIRNLKIELKRYLSRHGDLVKQHEWIEALRSYGLPVPKDDNEDNKQSCDDMVQSGDNLKPEDEPNDVTCNHESAVTA